jgi:hypothetical protein
LSMNPHRSAIIAMARPSKKGITASKREVSRTTFPLRSMYLPFPSSRRPLILGEPKRALVLGGITTLPARSTKPNLVEESTTIPSPSEKG